MASMLRHQANTSRADDDGNTSKNVHSRRSGFKEFLPWQKKGKGLQIVSKMKDRDAPRS
jgi:hypothetical protein